MEFVQTVLVQIEESKIDEASRPLGLLADLDEHISYLQQERGFLDMRVTRSINEEGNVLLMVQTRWRNDTSLMDYETQEPNVVTILSKHQDLFVPDSLQVLDMESIRAEARREHAPIKGWQIGLVAVVAIAVLVGGAIFAVVRDDGGEPAGAVGQPDASPAADASPASNGVTGGLTVKMGDNFFDFQGEQAPTIEVAAGEEATFDLSNDGLLPHNMRIAGADNEFNTDDDFVSAPDLLMSGDTGANSFKIDQPGTYNFRCDFHPIEMIGTLEVR